MSKKFLGENRLTNLLNLLKLHFAAKTEIPTVPTKVSDLTNDSGFTSNTGTVTKVKVGTTEYNPSSGVVSLPSYPTNTDSKVTQTNSSGNANYRILFSETADDTTRTEGSRKNGGLTYNPSTDVLTIGTNAHISLGSTPVDAENWSNFLTNSGLDLNSGINISQNDNETSGIHIDGNTIVMWSPCDDGALTYYDEDGGNVVFSIDDSGNYYKKDGTSYLSSATNYAGSSSQGGAASSLAGLTLSTTSNLGIDNTTVTQQIGYVSGLTKAAWNSQQTDGALYKQTYSNAWSHMIFGDYRTGHLAVRGRNNGSFTTWLNVLDSGNYTTWCTPANIGAAASSHTHSYLADTTKYAGSASQGGDATRAVKLKDYANNNDTYLDYGSSALAAANVTYLGAWNGYRMGSIHKDNVGGLISSLPNLTGSISYKGTKATYPMIKWKDNTNDGYGNGIIIGGGGLTVVGGGEAADTIAAQYSSGGDETLHLGNDGNVIISTNCQSGYQYAKHFTFYANGTLRLPGRLTTGGNIVDTTTECVALGYMDSDGYITEVDGTNAVAEGGGSISSNNCTHAEGHRTEATACYSHAEGNHSHASGSSSHAEGFSTHANSWCAHAEGKETYASGYAAHAEGGNTDASGNYSHAEGYDTNADEWASHAEGSDTSVYGGSPNSHAEGHHTVVNLVYDSAMTHHGGAGHAEGSYTTVKGYYGHAGGYKTLAKGHGSFAHGYLESDLGKTWESSLDTDTYGRLTATGYGATALGFHRKGHKFMARGNGSFAMGYIGPDNNNTNAKKDYGIVADGNGALAGGYSDPPNNVQSYASGNGAICWGQGVEATASCSAAFNYLTKASGQFSFAAGQGTIAAGGAQTAIGAYNSRFATSGNYFIVGKGTSSASANCFRVNQTAIYSTGSYNTTGADYAEMFEWADGNLNKEDRVGRFVKLSGDKIELAESINDEILGIVSGNASVCGDVHDDQWHSMYLYDVFGRPVYEDVEIEEITGKDEKTGDNIIEKHIERRQKLNPDYDSTKEYVPRSERPEWNAVGILGKLIMIDDGTAEVNNYVKPTTGGIATTISNIDIKTKFRVMRRLDNTHIEVLILN